MSLLIFFFSTEVYKKIPMSIQINNECLLSFNKYYLVDL